MTIRMVLALLACSAFGCSGGDGAKAAGKSVIVLGFDGMDYALTKKLMEEGRLPNFSKLAAKGSFGPLETSVPPQSPVAWSNFITGLDNGGHGIYDFVHRDPDTLLPYLSTSKASDEGTTVKIGKYQFPLSGGEMELMRKGRAFWEVLENHGIETTVIRMPANYPPSGTASFELSGMGTPDLSGTYGEFSFYTSKLFAFAGQDISSGNVYEVDIFDGVVDANLYALENPILVEPEKLTSEFTVYLDPVDPVVRIVAGTEEVILEEGEWSGWVPVDFELLPFVNIGGMVRFYLRSVRPDFELYASPVNIDPMAPEQVISTPEDYAEELAKATGRFYTQGMPEDTAVRENDVFTAEEFLEQAEIAGREIVEQYHYVLDQFDEGLLFYYTGNVDQISHIMWHTLDPDHPAYDPEADAKYADLIPSLYEGLDDILGYTLEHIESRGDDTTVIVMSDHGFTSYRRAFHLNAWLAEKGFLVVKDPDMENDPGLFVNVDWEHTQAYGVGINGLYINLKGRDKNGIVPPERREALMDEIAEALLAEIDPVTGAPAVTKMYKREEVFKDRGELEIGPDLIVGYAKGTRGSGHDALGAVGKVVLEDNLDEWPGDHLMDHEAVPGVLLTSSPLAKPAIRLQDLGASVLAEFGVDEPINRGSTSETTDATQE